MTRTFGRTVVCIGPKHAFPSAFGHTSTGMLSAWYVGRRITLVHITR